MMIIDFLRDTVSSFFYLLVTPFCVYCREWLYDRQRVLCNKCTAMVQPVVSVDLEITKTYKITVHALSAYRDPLRTLIQSKRFGDRIAAYDLGRLLWQLTYFNHLTCDYLVPIPLHWTRYARRGYNQAEEMAHELGHRRQVPVAKLLKRVRKTEFQAQLDKESRSENVQGAFVLDVADSSLYAGKHLILIDDLMTTGATLKEAVRLLRTLKPASITALVACRVI